MNIAVFGGGSWATAIVKILTEVITERQAQSASTSVACNSPKALPDKINWWVREPEIRQGVSQTGYNPLYLSYCELDKTKINVSNDIRSVISQSDILFFVIPAAFLEVSLQDVATEQMQGKKIVSAIKGIVPSCNSIVSNWFLQKYNLPLTSQAVISGPSHAEEIAAERLTYLTCASHDDDFAALVSDIISCRFVKTVLSRDIEGIEYGAVMKNIYALAAGIAKGMGYGDNFVSVLIANALQETESFLNKIVPSDNSDENKSFVKIAPHRDVKRLAYLGDLLVTAYSQHSRNRTFGQMIGQGYSVQSAQLEMKMIAEGYYSAKCIHDANKQCGCTLPIAEAVYNILYKGSDKRKEFRILSDTFR